MATNKLGPPCPECGSRLTDVVSTVRTDDQGFWRSRKCPCCGHKFHSVQQPEQYVIDGSVRWLAAGKLRQAIVNWNFYSA